MDERKEWSDLTNQEQIILMMRTRRHSLSEIADVFEMNTETVRRIEHIAMAKLTGIAESAKGKQIVVSRLTPERSCPIEELEQVDE